MHLTNTRLDFPLHSRNLFFHLYPLFFSLPLSCIRFFRVFCLLLDVGLEFVPFVRSFSFFRRRMPKKKVSYRIFPSLTFMLMFFAGNAIRRLQVRQKFLCFLIIA